MSFQPPQFDLIWLRLRQLRRIRQRRLQHPRHMERFAAGAVCDLLAGKAMTFDIELVEIV